MKNFPSCSKYTLLFTFYVFLFPTVSRGQHCVTKCNDFITCDAFTASARCRSCIQCPDPPICLCVSSAQSVSYLDTPHPGVLLRQLDGHIIVAKVLRGSPALYAGIRSGDEIVRINGNKLPVLDCENQGWGSIANPHDSLLTVRRDGTDKIIRVRLVPLRLLVENVWQRSAEESVSIFGSSRPQLPSPRYELGTFTVGIRTVRHHSRMMIAAVLENSPASRAGLQPGDEIVRLNGALAVDWTDGATANMLGLNSETVSTLTVRRASLEWDVTVAAEGLAGILNRIEVPRNSRVGKTEMARAQ